MRKIHVLTTVTATLIILGCAGGGKPIVPRLSAARLDVASVSKDGRYLTGTVTNESTSTLRVVQVKFTLHDADGSQIGTATAFTQNLAPGGIWKFRTYTEVNYDSYRVVDVVSK